MGSVWGSREPTTPEVAASTAVTVDAELVGREEDLRLVRWSTERARAQGGALVLVGEPGIGKSVLLDAGVEHAAKVGMRSVRSAGVQYEVGVSFSGLSRALDPFRSEIDGLPRVFQDALRVSLGLADGPAPDRLVLSNAVLDLLVRGSERRGLLVVVDDLQWLDRSTAAIVASVARRLSGTPVGFLGALRSQSDTFFDPAGLPVHELDRLAANECSELLRRRFPAMVPRVRRRILTEADGNPLALLELPMALSVDGRDVVGPLPPVLSISGRLQAVFETRVGHLPLATRRALLMIALEGSTGRLARTGDAAHLGPAERAGLVRIDATSNVTSFRHPLIRSAVVGVATSEERRDAHRVIAGLVSGWPEHQAWHLAEAAEHPDEHVAAGLDRAAHRMLRRGDAVTAVMWLTRAADLSPTVAAGRRRLAEAAYIGADVTGDLHLVSTLLVEGRHDDVVEEGSLRSAVAAAHLMLNGEGDIDTAHRVLVGAIGMNPNAFAGRDPALAEALHTLLLVDFFGGRPELWGPLEAALDDLGARAPTILRLCAATSVDPARTAAAALPELDVAIGQLTSEQDPAMIVRTAIAALYVDRLAGCRGALWRVVADGRSGGAVGSAIHALMMLWMDHFLAGEWDEAEGLAREGHALADMHGYRLLVAPGLYGRALIAANRGDRETTRQLTEEMDRWARPRGVRTVELYAHHVRAMEALGRADFEGAYRHVAFISSPGELAARVPHALWVTMDLVEATIGTGRLTEARSHVDAMRDAGVAQLSPRLALYACGAAAMVAPDEASVDLYEAALASAGIERFPFDAARVQLSYGASLRRMHAMPEARRQLKAALDTFKRVEARPWCTRAEAELRAAGVSGTATAGAAGASLSAQENEIAALAAAGLSNREIAGRLNLSHRTVGAHLYRIFPKLGVTSRAALRDALDARDGVTPERT